MSDTEQVQKQKKRKVLDAQILQAFESTKPLEQHSFESPSVVPDELKECYEEHKRQASGYTGPWKPPVVPEEDMVLFARIDRIKRKRDRLSPTKNVDLMPEKGIVEEKW